MGGGVGGGRSVCPEDCPECVLFGEDRGLRNVPWEKE